MMQTLGEYHRQILAGIAEIRDLCERAHPNMAALGAARVRLSRHSVARSKFVHETLIPQIRKAENGPSDLQLGELQRAFSAKRLISSQHITTWSSKAIEEDWNGYREAARRICAMMEDQVEREAALFRSSAMYRRACSGELTKSSGQ